MKKTGKIILGIFIIFFLAMIAIYLGVSVYFNERFFTGTVINGIDASTKTVSEVEDMIANDVQDYTLSVKLRGDKEEKISGAKIGFEYVSEGAVQELKDQQNSFMWLYAYFNPEDYTTSAKTTYDDEKLQAALKELDCFNEELVTKPENAYLKETAAGHVIEPEVEGNELDYDRTYEVVNNAVDAGETQVNLEENQCYKEPSVRQDNKNLNKQLATYNKYENMTVTYQIGERQEILDSATICSWMTVGKKGKATFDWNLMADWMSAMSDKYDTFGSSRPFLTSLGETVQVKSETYGWLMDEATEVAELEKILAEGVSTIREPVYLETARARGENDIGDTYVEVDYTNQRLWFYKNGELIVDTPVVTGNTAANMASPEGVFCIYNMDHLSLLKGEDYRTPVEFWMPFSGGVGLHDAAWRSSFGGTLYQGGGSHGCINIPYDNAAKIYSLLEIGDPVVCYSAPTNLGQGATSVAQSKSSSQIKQEYIAEKGPYEDPVTGETQTGETTGETESEQTQGTGESESSEQETSAVEPVEEIEY